MLYFVIQIVPKMLFSDNLERKMLITAEKEFAPHHMYLFLQRNVNKFEQHFYKGPTILL